MRRRGPRPALRLITLLGIFLLLFVTVVVRLVQLQVVRAEPLELLGTKQRVRSIELPAKRGAIFDRNMVPLAVSNEARAIYANPKFVQNPGAVAAQLSPILGVDQKILTQRLSNKAYGFVYLARKVEPAVADRILALRLPFIGALHETSRAYPADAVAGQILGFVNVDNVGLSGMESMYNKLLSGKPGEQIIERDPQGRPIPQGRNSTVEPVPGRGLVLTIDRDIQYYAEAALGRGVRSTGADSGSAIVMDPRTGDVLAMANWPPLNPNSFGSATADAQRNRTVTDVYEPGSVNKVVTASAALEAGIISPADRLTVPYRLHVGNKVFTDFEYHPTKRMSYAESIAESSNIGTIEVALRLGKQRLYDMLRRYGVGRATGVGFPGESSGLLLPLERWYSTSIATIPIGQGVAETPLQVASIYSTIANNGLQVQPRLVAGVVQADGSVRAAAASARHRVTSPFTAAQIRGMLVGVVEEGTGKLASIPGYVVGGKTGTARAPLVNGRGYSSNLFTTFVGMAPADDTRLVVLTQMHNPHPRYSALTAAPVFKQIMEYSLAHLGIPPTVPLRSSVPLIEMRARGVPVTSPRATVNPSPSATAPKKKARTP